MDQNKPLGSSTPETPQTEPEVTTPEGSAVPTEELPSMPEVKEKAEEAAEPEMIIEEAGERTNQEPVKTPEEPESASVIKESDVTNNPIILEEEASDLVEAINSQQ